MRLVVARIGRAHGIRGEVTVEVRTDDPGARLGTGAVLHVPDGGRRRELAAAGLPTSLTVTGYRDHNGITLLRFAEVPDRSAAEALRDTLLETEVPEESGEDDAWYEHELLGLAVVRQGSGEKLGEVAGLHRNRAQDLLVVRTPGGERLVPFVRAIVPVVDVAGGVVVVDPPGGLLDDHEPDDAPSGPSSGPPGEGS